MTFEDSAASASESGRPVREGGTDRLEDRAFSSITVPGRPGRPRELGQTVVADKGLGPSQVGDLLEMVGDFVDWVKIASSTARLYRPASLRDKLARYDEAGVRVLLTGDVVELGVVRGLADDIYGEAAELGFTAVEVASAQTVVSPRVKADLVRKAASHGLLAFAEIGRKGSLESRPHGSWLAAQADLLLAAGAYRVLLQGEGIVEDVAEVDEQVLLTLAASVPVASTVFQAKDTRSQAWFITHLGPETNLDVDAPSVAQLELMRRGLRSRGLAGLVATSA